MPKKAKLVNVSDEATTYEEVVETLLEQNEPTPVIDSLTPNSETVEKPKRVRTKTVQPTPNDVEPSEEVTIEVEKPKRVRTKTVQPTPNDVEPSEEVTIDVEKPQVDESLSLQNKDKNSIVKQQSFSPTEAYDLQPAPKAKSKAKAKAQPVELSGKFVRVLTTEEVETKKNARAKREPKPKLPSEPPSVRRSRAVMRAELYERLAASALP